MGVESDGENAASCHPRYMYAPSNDDSNVIDAHTYKFSRSCMYHLHSASPVKCRPTRSLPRTTLPFHTSRSSPTLGWTSISSVIISALHS
jgi:hypothetical protein